uniref:7TM_GPCR_Srx domain-containing protein n=1 Tax=Steinernema glaseri TaxID=37863 RepID=A0A1I7Z3N7_9BILA
MVEAVNRSCQIVLNLKQILIFFGLPSPHILLAIASLVSHQNCSGPTLPHCDNRRQRQWSFSDVRVFVRVVFGAFASLLVRVHMIFLLTDQRKARQTYDGCPAPGGNPHEQRVAHWTSRDDGERRIREDSIPILLGRQEKSAYGAERRLSRSPRHLQVEGLPCQAHAVLTG